MVARGCGWIEGKGGVLVKGKNFTFKMSKFWGSNSDFTQKQMYNMAIIVNIMYCIVYLKLANKKVDLKYS